MPDASPTVVLRPVEAADVDAFFEHQDDSEASRMAAFPSRTAEAHAAHWDRILHNPAVIARTIVADGEVAGNIGSWEDDGVRAIGYWIGRAHWGRGIATKAVVAFVDVIAQRPLHAHVVTTNVASLRVLEKAGFRIAGSEYDADGDVEELDLVLDA